MFEVPKKLSGKVMSAQQAADLITDGAVVAAGGYSGAGEAKATLMALAERGKSGEIREIDLITSAQLSMRVENALAEAGILRRRVPFTTASAVRKGANRGDIHYVEMAMSKVSRMFASGALGAPDIALVEALGMDENGALILTTGIGMTPLICKLTPKIIVEINRAQPAQLYGLHDFYETPQHMGTVLQSAGQRIGSAVIPVESDKIVAIVYNDEPDETLPPGNISWAEEEICRNLLAFLQEEYPCVLPPVQTGIGTLSQAVLKALADSPYENLEIFCGALQADTLELLARGKAKTLSGGSVEITPRVRQILEDFGPDLKDHLILRNIEMSNSAAALSNLGVVALNTGIEIDMYGNVNASHIGGGSVVNGIGGGATFAQNSALSVVMISSVRKDGKLSCIVPAVPHVDIAHHDVDVVVSEFGVADLRGKDDIECARTIIGHCAHPDYRAALERELERGIQRGGHHPTALTDTLAWHDRLARTGTMRE